MYKTIYCDTNVFDHMYKQIKITQSDLNSLRSLVNSRKIIIPRSVYNIEEMLPLFGSTPDMAESELRLVGSLYSNKIIKPVDEYLTQVIRSYATKGEDVNPYVLEGTKSHSELHTFLMNPTKKNFPFITEIIQETKAEKNDFVYKMQASKKENNLLIKEIRHKLNGKKLDFEHYFKLLYEKFACQVLLKPTGTEEQCKERGIEGFLNTKPIRMFIGSRLSYTYAQGFEGREPKSGDSRDLLHAISATVADVFITQDKKLERLLSRIHIDNFEVMNLQTFLARELSA